jgi:uncharacterized membrane protein YfcA
LFGVGSAFATPVLSLVGVPGLAAVVAPLPALLPSSVAGAWSYARGHNVDRPLARRAIVAGFPAAVAGSVTSQWVGGPALLVLSGLVLLLVGVRVAWPAAATDSAAAARRRASLPFVTTAAAVVGFSAGLLANGGGFLLVPLFLVVLGLNINEATGTSLLIAAALTVPTLATHIVMGDVVWGVAGPFALGLIPGALVGGVVAQRLPATQLRSAFGVLLVGFAGWYLARQLPAVL